MNYKFRHLRTLGAMLEQRAAGEDDPNYKLAKEIDEAIAEAVDGLTDRAKDEITKVIEEKMGVALKEAAEKAGEKAGEEAEKAADDVKKAADEARAMLETAKRVASRMNTRACNVLRSEIHKNFEQIRSALRNSGTKPVEMDFSLRAPAMMTLADFATQAGQDGVLPYGMEFDDTVYEIRHPEDFILDVIGATQVAFVRDITYRGVATEEGMAEVVAEGGLKPMVSWTFKNNTASKQKTAAYVTLTDEVADEGELYNLVKYLLENKLLRDWKADVMGFFEDNSGTYLGSNALSGSMVKPTNAAAINAAALQLQNLGYEPDTLYVNPGDMAVDRFMQNDSGNFIYPLDLKGELVKFAKIRESYAVPAGKFFIADSSMISAVYTAVKLKAGWINDQLIHNTSTLVAELYWRVNYRNNEKNAGLWGDFATIKADLLTKEAAAANPAA
ncbi:MAG: hypothetical protein NC048_09985 [Bacteroides sp.]|nr:hypothetical protein [Bacteroides sp.]